MSARYLLRFDDLCPTMSRVGWERFLPLIARYKLKPILGIVPQNADPELIIDAKNGAFWEEMRRLQEEGAAVGLHGYTHVCRSPSGGLIPLHRKTEFAGIVELTQREWIQAGVSILRGQGLEPRIWVAPRHGFDAATLRVLAGEGIEALSDGFARRPFREGGVVWIPQQLWGPREMGDGVWTICLHANTATKELVEELEGFLELFSGLFTSVDEVLRKGVIRDRSVGDWWFHLRLIGRIRLGRTRIGRWRKTAKEGQKQIPYGNDS